MKRYSLLILTGILIVLALGCGLNPKRNEDGSFSFDVKLTQETIERQLQASLNDPQIQDVRVTLHDGYMLVSGTRTREIGGGSDMLLFRLDLAMRDGAVDAQISEVTLNGMSIDPAWMAGWSDSIADFFMLASQQEANSTLEAVRVTEEAVILTMRVGGQPRE